MSQRTSIGLIVGAALAVSGCATGAVRPRSPATSLKVSELLATSQPANERYYLLVFGSQSTPKLARYTHTWATMVRATTAPGQSQPTLEVSTISWMPATLDIRPARLTVEPGTNLSLEMTMQDVLGHKERVAMWGPYEGWHGLYDRFMTQKAFLESGQIGYQCIDLLGEAAQAGNGSDCIHAVTDMDPQLGRSAYPLTHFGQAASEHIVKQILERPVVIDAPQTHEWLIPRIGLERYPIDYRRYTGRVVPFTPEALQQSATISTSPSSTTSKWPTCTLPWAVPWRSAASWRRPCSNTRKP